MLYCACIYIRTVYDYLRILQIRHENEVDCLMGDDLQA